MTKPVTWTPTAAAALRRLEGKLFATTTECAAILRYDARALRRAIADGEVPAVKAGATFRIPTEWIRARIALQHLEGKLFATLSEAGAVLRYDHRTIRRGIEKGEIPAVRADSDSDWRIPTEWIRKQAGLGGGLAA